MVGMERKNTEVDHSASCCRFCVLFLLSFLHVFRQPPFSATRPPTYSPYPVKEAVCPSFHITHPEHLPGPKWEDSVGNLAAVLANQVLSFLRVASGRRSPRLFMKAMPSPGPAPISIGYQSSLIVHSLSLEEVEG